MSLGVFSSFIIDFACLFQKDLKRLRRNQEHEETSPHTSFVYPVVDALLILLVKGITTYWRDKIFETSFGCSTAKVWQRVLCLPRCNCWSVPWEPFRLFQTLSGLPKDDWFMICCLPLLAYRILQTDSGLDRLDSRICAAALHGGCSRMFSRMFKSDIEWTDVNWFLLFSFHHRVSGCFWFW